nr:hypothetical protein [Flavobacterium sp.]
MLKENGGKHVFGHSWSQRFWRRNGFSNRAATSKMRDLPADFNEKKETYIRIAATDIVEHHAEYGYESVCKEYANELFKYEGMTKKATLNRWKREKNDSKILKASNIRLPKYGKAVEEGLVTDITK